MNQKLKSYEEKYSTYLKQIDKILPQSVIVISQSEFHKMQQDSGSLIKEFKDKVSVLEGELEILDKKYAQSKEDIKILREDKEIMKGYIENLQAEVNDKTRDLQNKTKELEEFREEQEKLAQLINAEREGNKKLKLEKEEERINSMKIIED